MITILKHFPATLCWLVLCAAAFVYVLIAPSPAVEEEVAE